MASIYIHIPFCKKKCIYCNFYFSTNLSFIDKIFNSLLKEIILKKNFLYGFTVNTIYFGGGTPSILSYKYIYKLLETIYFNYNLSKNVEITLECNPGDINKNKLKLLYNLGINRLSLGVQSFIDNDLIFMNRTHTSQEAYNSIIDIKNAGFININIDLIYGFPTMNNANIIKNIEKIIDLDIPHVSAYCLTIEPKTKLYYLIKKNKIYKPNDAIQVQQYNIIKEITQKNNFIQYEISNFGKKGFFSKHNRNYWECINPYIGIGPSANSFKGNLRQYNINNNIIYINSIENGIIPVKEEFLSLSNIYNEHIITGLRTIWGVDLKIIKKICGINYYNFLIIETKKFILKKILYIKKNKLILNKKYWLYADKISTDLLYYSS